MAEATKDPSAPSSASGTRSGAGFELRLERGGAFVRLADQPIAPGVRLDALTLELPDVRFPFDVGKGSGQFRHRLSDLSELAIAIEPGVADATLAAAGLAAFGVEEARIAFRAGTAEIAARLSGGPAFTLVAGLLPEGDQGVALVFHSPRIYGPAPIPAALLPHLARGVVDALGADALPREPVPFLLRRILAPRGWKLPRTAGVPLARAEIAEGLVRLAWLRGAAGPAAVSPDPDLLAAEEGARTFREPEARLAAGDAAGAREGYLAAGAAASAHPFAAERLLSLLAAEDRFHDEALDLAAEWLSRRPGFLPALAAEASIRLARGEPVKAARALAALAAGAAVRGETFSALAAAEAVLALPGAAREEAVRAAELALSVRRDHVPALRALRAHAAAAGDREGLLRALRRLVAHDPEDAEKARAHAELGTLLLEADPPAARLHLDHALRLAPEDPDALAALARACRAAEEPLRAVRVLERLCAAQLARGDRAAAAAAATEAGTLWEERLLHPENALLRHREACELAPSPQAHARAASAAEAAGQWAEAAEHHAAVVAALPPSTPGASELLVRTRVALADVAEARLADPPAAAAHLEAATALAPERADLLRRLAALHAATGREDGALAALDRLAPLLPSGPERASVLAGAGQAAAALGRTADARSRFAAALAADERCGPALDGLARLAAARGDAAAEREALGRLATLATSAAEAAGIHDRLAGACERAGDLVGALRAAAAARAAEPGPARLDALLALARRAEDLPLVSALLAERAALAAAAGDAPGAAAAWLDRARVLGPVDPAGARAALAEARAAAPGDASVLRAQADHAELAGDAPLTLGCLRALLAGAPADAPDLEVRASRAALATGDATAARAHAERALELGAAGATELACAVLDRPGDDAARAVLLERLGRFLEAADLHARAGATGRERAALERAAEDPAAAAAALARLAGLREAEGDRAGAGAALLGLARLTPGAEGARVALRAHDLSADPAALDVALERDPSLADARARRAAARAEVDPRAALADAEAALASGALDGVVRAVLLALAARCAEAAGDAAAARRHLAARAELAPQDDGALARLAALERAAGATADLARTLTRRLSLATGADAIEVRLDLSDALASQDPARATLLARDALARDPGALRALRALAEPPRAEHVPPAERAEILERLAAHPELPTAEAGPALVARARLLAGVGDAAGALVALRSAAERASLDDDALELRAALAAAAGAPAEAAEALLARAAAGRDRGEAGAAERLAEAGLAAIAAGVAGGEEALRDAVARRPERETERLALEALARLARGRGDAAGEREALAALVPLLPTGARPAALLRHSTLALAAGDATLSRASAEEARRLAPRNPSAVEACREAAEAVGDLAAVADLLGDLATLEPDLAGLRLLARARILEALGEPRRADPAFAEALGSLPPDRALADEHARLRQRAGLAAPSAPLEAFARRTLRQAQGERNYEPAQVAGALREAAALALTAGEPDAALRCARRAHALAGDDLAFAGPLLARLLYLGGAVREGLALGAQLLDAPLTGIDAADAVVLWDDLAELAADAGETELALAALDRLLALRPGDIGGARRRLALDPDRRRAALALADAADACPSRRERALGLADAAAAAVAELRDDDLAARLFARAAEAAASAPALAAEIARRRADALRGAGALPDALLPAIEAAAHAARRAGDPIAEAALLDELSSCARAAGRGDEAVQALIGLERIAADDGALARAAGLAREVAALLLEAGDPDGAAVALRRAAARHPASAEDGLPLLLEALRARPRERAELLLARASAAEGAARAKLLLDAAADLEADGDGARAAVSRRAAFAACPSDDASFEAALGDAGDDFERREAVLATRAAAVPDHALACHRARGDALSTAGAIERATEAYEAALALEPGDGGALAGLAACVAVTQGDRAAAELDLRVILRAEIAGDVAPEDEAPSRYRLGLAAVEDGRPGDGIPQLERALSLAPADARAEWAWAVVAGAHAAGAEVDAGPGDPEPYAAASGEMAGADWGSGTLEEVGGVETTVESRPAAVDGEPGLELDEPTPTATGSHEAGHPERSEAASAAERSRGAPTPTQTSTGSHEAGHPERSEAASAAERSRGAATPTPTEGATETEAAGGWDDLVLDRDDADESTVVDERAELPELAHDLQSATELALLATDDPGLSLEELALMPPADPGFSAAADSTGPDPSAPAAPRADSPEEDDAPPLHGDDPAPTIAPGDYDPRAAASACVERALATEIPADRAAALLAAAGLLARAGAPADEVRPLLDVACEADPDSAEVFRARARVEAAVGDVMAAARALLSASIRAEGDEAGAAALEAASLFEEVGAPVEAARAYRAALHAQPGSPAARLALAETALASGDAAAATEHLGAIDASAVTGGERTELARRLARAFERAGHAAEAERVWRTVLEADPGDTEAFDRAEALAVETAVAGDGSTATPTTATGSPEAVHPEPFDSAASGRYAQETRSRGTTPTPTPTATPTESIEAVHPERSAAEGGAESRDAWLEIARCDPADAEALRAVASLAAAAAQGGPAADRARLAELARLATSLAAFVAPGEEAPPASPARLVPISPSIRDRVAAPGATGPLARLLALLSPLLEPLFPASLARCGATPADRLAPPRAPTLHAALEDARAALRGRPFAAFVSATPGADIAIENTQPPSLVAAAGVEALAPGVLAFAATRAVDLLGHGWALTGKFAPRDVAILLELACRFAGGVPPSQGLPAERAGAFLAALEISVPPPVRAEARRLAREASEELAATDPRALAAALRRTANRVALLRCGDPGAALDALVCGDRRLADTRPAPAQALALADLRDVALFALSDPFLELRLAALG